MLSLFFVTIFRGDLEVLILTQCRNYCTAQRGTEFEHAVAGAAANSKVRLMALIHRFPSITELTKEASAIQWIVTQLTFICWGIQLSLPG